MNDAPKQTNPATSAPVPPEATPPEARQPGRLLRAWHIARRVFRWARIAVLMVLLAVVALVSGLVGTSTGTALLLDVGQGVYNDMIPGRIAIGRVGGSLLGGFTLDDVAAYDAQNRLLAGVAHFELGYNALMLTALSADVDHLVLIAPEVHLYNRDDGQSAFLDLAPPPSQDDGVTEEPEPESAAPGFSLPIAVRLGRLFIDAATVVDHRGDAPTSFAQAVSLELSATADGPNATVNLTRLDGRVPVADLAVDSARFEAGWKHDTATLKRLKVESSYGAVAVDRASFNPWTFSGDVLLEAHIDEGRLAQLAGRRIENGAQLTLNASGDMEALDFKLLLSAGGGRVQASGWGAIQPELKADLSYRLADIDPRGFAVDVDALVNAGGVATLSGQSLETMRASLEFTCGDCRLEPVGKIALTVSGKLAEQNAHASVHAAVGDVTVQATGDIAEFETLAAKLSIDAPDLAPVTGAFVQPPIRGDVELDADCSGPLTAPRCRIEGEGEGLAMADVFALKSFELDATTEPKEKTLKFVFDLDARDIAAGGVGLERLKLQANGTPESLDVALAVDVDGPYAVNLAANLHPGPPLKLKLVRLDGMLGDDAFRLMRAAALALDGPRVELDDFELLLGQARISASGYVNPQGRNDVRLQIQHLPLALFGMFVKSPQPAGVLDLRASLGGLSRNPQIRLATTIDALAVDGAGIGDVSLEATLHKRRAEVSLALEDDDLRVVTLNASAPVSLNLQSGALKWLKHRQHSISWVISDVVPERLEAFIDLPEQLGFVVTGQGKLEGTVSDFSLDASLDGYLSWEDLDAQPFELVASASADKQAVTLAFADNGPIPLHVAAETEIPVAAMLTSSGVDVGNSPLAVTADIKPMPMGIANPFLPTAVHELSGELEASVQVGGTLAQPDPNGWVRIKNGQVYVLNITDPFYDIGLDVGFTRDSLRVKSLQVKSGNGVLTAKGEVSGDADTMQGRIETRAKEFLLELPGMPQTILNAVLNVDTEVTPAAVNVNASISDGSVDVYTTFTKQPKTIPASPNIHFVSDEEKQVADEPEVDHGADFRPIHVTVDISDPVIIRGDMLDMEWQGKVNADVTADGASVTGGLVMERGRFDFLGNSFDVDRAALDFPPGNSNIPFLNLSANTSLSEAVVTLTLKGRVTEPELKLKSNPPMPEYQVFSMLVTGTAETTQEDGEAVRGKAANLGTGLIAYKYPQLQQQIRQRTGIDRVGLAFGDTAEEPILTVGKRLTRRVYIESRYHHNAPVDVNTVQAKVEVKLVPRWTMETFYGDANVGGIDFFWQIHIGKDNAPPTASAAPPPGSEPTSGRPPGQSDPPASPDIPGR